MLYFVELNNLSLFKKIYLSQIRFLSCKNNFMIKTKTWYIILLRLSGVDILTFLVRGKKLYTSSTSLKNSNTFFTVRSLYFVFIYSMYKASIRIINLFLLLLYLHILCLVISLHSFFAQC